MAVVGSESRAASRSERRYALRLLRAVSLYLVLPVAGFVLVLSGWVWVGLAVGFLNLLVLLALILVFSTFPLPARQRTLRRNDFAALTWLPHVAVTRLTEKGLEGRVRGQLVGRCVLAVVLLVGGSCPMSVSVLGRQGIVGASGWFASALILCAAFLSIAYVGREIRAADGRLDRGIDIG